MKNIKISMMLFAAAAMTFASCQEQEIETPKEENPKDETTNIVTVSELTFASEKPVLAGEEAVADTKTEWNGTTVQWSAGDKIRVAYTRNGIWQNEDGTAEDNSSAELYESAGLASATDVAKFKLSGNFKLNADATGPYKFYGVYPSSIASDAVAFSSAPSLEVTIPAVQTPSANSYDSAADLMTAVSDEQDTFSSEQEISLKWSRLVAHANITVKGLKDVEAGETVTSVTLTANSGAAMTGTYSVNLEDKTVTANTASNSLTVKGDNLSLVASEAAHDVSFWAAFLPIELSSLKLVVETNNASYTREISDCSLNFLQNRCNVLTVNMGEVERVLKGLTLENVEVPSAVVNRGAEVTFKATGLEAGDKIVFSSDAYPGTHTVEAALTMTADGASFTVPASCYGINRMTVVRGKRTAELGNLSVAAAVGDMIGGGIVYYVSDGGVHGLIAAKENVQPNNTIWGPTELLNTPDSGIYTGKENTRILVENMVYIHQQFYDWAYEFGLKHVAEKCDEFEVVVDGVTYDDWFLPSLDELMELNKVHDVLVQNGYGLPAENYWTSTEHPDWPAGAVYYVDFWTPASHTSGVANKMNWKINTRAVRQF